MTVIKITAREYAEQRGCSQSYARRLLNTIVENKTTARKKYTTGFNGYSARTLTKKVTYFHVDEKKLEELCKTTVS